LISISTPLHSYPFARSVAHTSCLSYDQDQLVDVLVNGSRLVSRSVQPGAFEIPQLPVVTGAGSIAIQTALHAEGQGAVSFADGGLFASNTINDSFAVVDTGGVEGIRVSNENREVGRTDSAGRLLVPDLRSYDVNRLSIDPTDAPADATVAFASRDVRPQDRSGVVVHFPVRASQGALLRLVDEAGRPLPVGSVATLAATRVAVPVGYDGEAYVQDLDRRNRLTIERPDGRRCAVSFEYAPVKGEIPTIGPLACRESRP